MDRTYYTYVLTDPRTNVPFYVGKGTKRRMYQHKLDAVSRFNPNKLVHIVIMDIIDAGFDILYSKILINATQEQALVRESTEICGIGRLDLGSGPLLNLTDGGEGHVNLSKLQQDNKRQKSSKPVTQYDLDGNFISHFDSAKHAGEQTAANRGYIAAVCKKKRKSSGGFLWTYKGDPKPSFNKKYYHAVSQYNKDGTFIAEYRSITEAVNQTGVGLYAISSCCRGLSNTAGGFLWSYNTNSEYHEYSEKHRKLVG